ncbi:phosphotransferase [Neolewinella lacunae]|uniref:Maltokinase n=1 Tax=Neolewinella lacunae TaxID=1517758 RepID=A0A923PIQ1_9BACT|nr:phosphotransferase [Neolewinella lacunae]MBC6993426.1 phosphotransferase [Neolewinella lacunae]MDN3636298.1 phosphotransferase [Neolewinella lacunae]
MQASVPLKDRFAQPRFTYALLEALPEFLARQRWFTSKGKVIAQCRVVQSYRVTEDAVLAIVQVHFSNESTELFQMPLAQLLHTEDQRRYLKENENSVLLRVPGGPFIVDAVPLPQFRAALYALLRAGETQADGLACEAGKVMRTAPAQADSVVPAINTSNTAIVYHDRFFFKLFRKLDPGLNPDLELVRYLSERAGFQHCPTYAGSLGVGKVTDPNYLNLGLLTGKIDNRAEAWDFFLERAGRYYAGTGPVDAETLERASLLGQRTAEMHLGLAGLLPAALGADAGAMITPEAMSVEYRHEITAAATKLLARQIEELRAKLPGLPPAQASLAQRVLEMESDLAQKLAALDNADMALDLIRIHGDYHLGQVLVTEDDFCIIDFEGEPLLTIPERRRKRPALKDVAGMVRSFHYAARGELLLNAAYAAEARAESLVPRAEAWFQATSTAFLEAYYGTCGSAPFLPAAAEDRQLLLELFILEKAIYEVAYELNSRPSWLPIPLNGLLMVANAI